jgi:hypothetical protein
MERCEEATLPLGLIPIPGIHATVERKKSNMALANCTGRPICIPKGALLGRAEPLQPDAQVCAVLPTVKKPGEKMERRPDDKDPTQISEAELRKCVADMRGVRDDIKEQLLKMLLEHRWVFRTDLSGAGAANLEPMKIVTTDEEPTQARGPRLSPKEQEAERAELEKMARSNVVDKTRSAWSSPVMMVPKSDGSIRFCIDFRGLNRKTIKDPYPLPRIDESLDKLGKAKWFSSFDLASGYWQMPLDPDSREKTAFTVRGLGRFHFLVVPMGLKNAPACFQRAMDKLLEGLLDDTLAYLDDVLVYSNTEEEHLKALERYLERVSEAGLLLKWRKCHLFQREVRFLGYRVSAEGVSIDPERVRVITEMAAPTNPTGVRRFVAMCNYQRHFIYKFAEIAEPLHQLTRTGTAWVWGAPQQRAFETLKQKMVEAPILAHPDDSKPYFLETDASEGAGKQRSTIGAALCQEHDGKKRVVAYGSKILSQEETNSYRRAISDLELYAVVYWSKYWRHYLHGADFTVLTDHEPLVRILSPTRSAPATRENTRMARLTLKMEEFRPRMTVKHRPGKLNVLADALTREPIVPRVSSNSATAATAPSGNLMRDGKKEEMRALQKADPAYADIIDYMEGKSVPTDPQRARAAAAQAAHMFLEDGVLYNVWWPPGEAVSTRTRYQLAVPAGALRAEILGQYHDGPMGGHCGYEKVYERVRELYWWPQMPKAIKDYIAACPVCQAQRPPAEKYGLLQPIPMTARRPWSLIAMDFGGGLPESESGNKYVLAFVDCTSKEVELEATKDQETTTVARALMNRVFYRHGCCEGICSDQAANFKSGLMAEVNKIAGVVQRFSVAYHPQSHGQVENVLKQVWKQLAGHVSKHQRDWDQHLPKVEAVLRFSPSKTTGIAPIKMITGYDARLPIDTQLPVIEPQREMDRQPDAARRQEALTKELSEVFENVQKRVKKAQESQKKQHDKNRTDPGGRFNVGKRVMLLNKRPAFPGASTKLHLPFEGPFEVVEKKGDLNRVLRGLNNPDDFRLVHVDRLKPFVERQEDAKREEEGKKMEGPQPAPAREERKQAAEEKVEEKPHPAPAREDRFEVEEILQEKRDEKGKVHYLIKWKGFTARHNTWEPEENLDRADEVLQRFKQRPEQKRTQPVLNTKSRSGGAKSEKAAAPQLQLVKNAPAGPAEAKTRKAGGNPAAGKADWVPKIQVTRSGRTARNRQLEAYVGAARGRAAA